MVVPVQGMMLVGGYIDAGWGHNNVYYRNVGEIKV